MASTDYEQEGRSLERARRPGVAFLVTLASAMTALSAVPLVSCSRTSPNPSESGSGIAVGIQLAPANSGADPKSPVISPADSAFDDVRNGWGWSDRCYKEFLDGKLGWARAGCDRGLALPQVDPKARAALLYNEGLIARQSGDTDTARNYFGQCLALRPVGEASRAETERAFESVGGKVELGCKPTAERVVRELPDVKSAIDYDNVAVAASGGKLKVAVLGPTDNGDGSFTAIIGVDHPERFENQIFYSVDKAGHLGVTIRGNKTVVPPEAIRTVERACKR